YTGYRLASPQSFKRIFKIGIEQFMVFCITIISVLATDLLIGVCIGILAKLGAHLYRGVWLNNLFKIHFSIHRPDQKTIAVKIIGSALFSNFLPLRRALHELEPNKTIVFNFTEGYLIDHTVLEYIEHFSHTYQAQGGKCIQVGISLKAFSKHKLAARIMTEDDRNT
ncbi:MAG: SulP family inorganic anion transporter, partial [Methylococcales bacterium]|nr:SulP family inorganic anion transporter [Methylococcales bacterium]